MREKDWGAWGQGYTIPWILAGRAHIQIFLYHINYRIRENQVSLDKNLPSSATIKLQKIFVEKSLT
ncbi:MAG: hypothetical protein MJE68_03510 [Proteobacteria bacterium]|nr:hypothetical protein [Pseudomonadota bacterium]